MSSYARADDLVNGDRSTITSQQRGPCMLRGCSDQSVVRGAAAVEAAEQPLQHPRVRPLTGKLKGDCRVRIGGWRVLLATDRERKLLHVCAILPRGDAIELGS
jgi:mRNA-degrading endonuclease RelE of RelBE toxin-antitoxin system